MSDEEIMDDGFIHVCRPKWRTETVNNYIDLLDRRLRKEKHSEAYMTKQQIKGSSSQQKRHKNYLESIVQL